MGRVGKRDCVHEVLHHLPKPTSRRARFHTTTHQRGANFRGDHPHGPRNPCIWVPSIELPLIASSKETFPRRGKVPMSMSSRTPSWWMLVVSKPEKKLCRSTDGSTEVIVGFGVETTRDTGWETCSSHVQSTCRKTKRSNTKFRVRDRSAANVSRRMGKESYPCRDHTGLGAKTTAQTHQRTRMAQG